MAVSTSASSGAANPIAAAGIPQTLVALMMEPVFTQGLLVDAVVGFFGGNARG